MDSLALNNNKLCGLPASLCKLTELHSLFLTSNPGLGAGDVMYDKHGAQIMLYQLKRVGRMAPWGHWTAQSHLLFPKEVRDDVHVFLLLRQRLAWPLSRELIHCVIQWLATIE